MLASVSFPVTSAETQGRASSSSSSSPLTSEKLLLLWCKQITQSYKGVKVTNLTTSWRNGMAFCAIIHHFHPELIDFTRLSPTDAEANCRIAFQAGLKLGIPKLIEPSDMLRLDVPDKLTLVTYLYQLHAHFCGCQQDQVQQIWMTTRDSMYVVTDNQSDEDEEDDVDDNQTKEGKEFECYNIGHSCENVINTPPTDNHTYHHLSRVCENLTDNLTLSMSDENENNRETGGQSGLISPFNYAEDLSNGETSKIKTFFSRRLKSTKWKQSTSMSSSGNRKEAVDFSSRMESNDHPTPPSLMTRKQLMYPFDSDSEEEDFLHENKCQEQRSTRVQPGLPWSSNRNLNKINDFDAHFYGQSFHGTSSRTLLWSSPTLSSPSSSSSSSSSSSCSTSSSSSFSSFKRVDSKNVNNINTPLLESSPIVEPIELAPGLLDISPAKAFRLQRTHSATSSDSLLIDPRRRPLSRQEELQVRVRKMIEETRLEQSRKNSEKPFQEGEDERQKQLRERARKMIAEAREGWKWTKRFTTWTKISCEHQNDLNEVKTRKEVSRNSVGYTNGIRMSSTKRGVCENQLEINGNVNSANHKNTNLT